MHAVPFEQLDSCDLHVDATYLGGRSGNAKDDPFPRLLGVSNMGGFRYRGAIDRLELVLLTTSLNDPEWPDSLDVFTGVFTYYGDNKKPGLELHRTARNGNELLRRIFQDAEATVSRRNVPPVLVFSNAGSWRDTVFMGLAVPGTGDARITEDLVAVWKTIGGRRFQNYRARFTILDVPVVPRAWLQDIKAGNPHSRNAPRPWVAWTNGKHAVPLASQRSVEHRTKSEQVPTAPNDLRVLSTIHQHFRQQPHDFEECASLLARMLLPDITSLDVTRRSRDGGRDAIGTLRIGSGVSSIDVSFALEAKCYDVGNAVGVRDTSRLISRLRHRQFGILVTTSYVNLQAYQEIKLDEHPIIVLAGIDVVKLLRANGYSDARSVKDWLNREFPTDGSRRAPRISVP